MNEVSNQQNNNQEMEKLYYKPNEASFNFNGITLNVDIPTFVGNIKKIREENRRKKALKELKKLEGKTLRDAQHHVEDETIEVEEVK